MRTQGRNLEAGTHVEAIEVDCFLDLLNLLFNLPTQGWMASPIVVWALPHQSVSRKCSTGLPTGQSPGDILSGASFHPDDSSLCPVDIKVASTGTLVEYIAGLELLKEEENRPS